MPALTKSDVKRGLVAFLDQTVLEAQAAKQEKGKVRGSLTQNDPRPGPFVCVKADDTSSQWSPITTKRKVGAHGKDLRLAIEPGWRSGGPDRWRDPKKPQFLNDGANVYFGPTDDFVATSADEADGKWAAATEHARISADGMTAIDAEVARQTKRRDRPLV